MGYTFHARASVAKFQRTQAQALNRDLALVREYLASIKRGTGAAPTPNKRRALKKMRLHQQHPTAAGDDNDGAVPAGVPRWTFPHDCERVVFLPPPPGQGRTCVDLNALFGARNTPICLEVCSGLYANSTGTAPLWTTMNW